MRRPDDLVVFDLVFHGFTFHEGPPHLERAANDAYIVVEMPPQSFGEQAYLEPAPEVTMVPGTNEKVEVTSHPGYPDKNVDAGSEQVPDVLPAARVRMAGRSRVALRMPASEIGIAFDLSSMLAAWRRWPMRLDFNAVADPLQRFVGVAQLDPAASALLPAAGGASASIPAAGRAPIGAGTQAAIVHEESLGLVDEAIDEPDSAALAGIELAPLRPFLLGPHQPASDVTSLELPYRVVLSPLAPARWQHRDVPITHHGRTELWHTRLTTSDAATGNDQPSRIRALWSPDYRPIEQLDELIRLVSANPDAVPPEQAAPNPDLLRMSLDPIDRSMLVTLMAGFDATRSNGAAAYKPISSEAKRLHLSALGALLDAEGNWTTLPDGVDLQQWRHLATLGRDHYVRVMYAGYLCPFGHAASLVKVTERKFESIQPGSRERAALLRQRFFIVVREPVRTYDGMNHVFHGNNFPFRRVEIRTRVTPDLSEPGMGGSALPTTPPHGLAPRMLFWPMVPGASTGEPVDVAFQIATIDIDGSPAAFSMPLLFVGKLADDSAPIASAWRKAYNAAPADPKRRASLGATIVAYAPHASDNAGDPRLPTRSITFAAGNLARVAHPNVYPEVDVAEVGVKPIQKLLAQPDFVVEVAYPDVFKQNGFSAAENAGEVYLKLTKAVPLAFGGAPNQAKSDALGALASPQMNLIGLSRMMGPVGGKDAKTSAEAETALDNVKGGTFDPLDFFNDAKILGGVTLGDLLGIRHGLAGDDVPKLVARDFPDRTEASFHWATELDATNSKVLIPRADPGKPPTRLTMSGVVRTPHDPAKPASFEATADLDNFKVNLFGFVILWFERLHFDARNGRKPDVLVELRNGEDAVRFGGPLEFVNELRQYIPSNGFADPPGILVTPSGIGASYSLTLPAIGVGIFALSNASLGAGFNLPFDARPASVKFNFSERQHPFSLTVSLLGGGGFFLIGVSSQGVNEIEAALEFGAAIAIDLGVASGAVEVKAGIYFHWLEPMPGKGSVELAGYVRIHGELTVIAIISVSLTFNLQLGYLKDGGKSVVYGEATLVVEIEILMFSASVSVSCRREFAGGEADPKFIDLIPTQQIWTDYCEAFADEADF